jgi:hypothetical protein
LQKPLYDFDIQIAVKLFPLQKMSHIGDLSNPARQAQTTNSYTEQNCGAFQQIPDKFTNSHAETLAKGVSMHASV